MALSHNWPASETDAVVQLASTQVSPGTTATVPDIITVTNDIIHVTAGYASNGGAKSITDSQSETWTWGMAEVVGAGTGRMRPAWAKVTTGGSGRSVTLNAATSSDALAIGVDVLGGVDTTTPVHQIAAAAIASTTTPVTPSITTTVANCLLVGFLLKSNGGTNLITKGTIGGVTATQGAELDDAEAGAWFGLSNEYRIVSATGSFTAGWTFTAADTSMGGIVAYQAAAAAGGTWGPLLGLHTNRLVRAA